MSHRFLTLNKKRITRGLSCLVIILIWFLGLGQALLAMFQEIPHRMGNPFDPITSVAPRFTNYLIAETYQSLNKGELYDHEIEKILSEYSAHYRFPGAEPQNNNFWAEPNFRAEGLIDATLDRWMGWKHFFIPDRHSLWGAGLRDVDNHLYLQAEPQLRILNIGPHNTKYWKENHLQHLSALETLRLNPNYRKVPGHLDPLLNLSGHENFSWIIVLDDTNEGYPSPYTFLPRPPRKSARAYYDMNSQGDIPFRGDAFEVGLLLIDNAVLTHERLSELLKDSRIQILHIRNSTLTVDAMNAFSTARALEQLVIENCWYNLQASPSRIQENLSDAVEFNTVKRAYFLKGNYPLNDGLSEFLQRSTALEYLLIYDQSLTMKAFSSIPQGLRNITLMQCKLLHPVHKELSNAHPNAQLHLKNSLKYSEEQQQWVPLPDQP